jgi:hypothetical protein
LHRYTAIMLASARKPALTERLYRLARLCPRERATNYYEAVELTTHANQDATFELLGKRLA